MKIILCNKFYYHRGGDCIYTLNLEKLLKDHGHDVAIYSMQYPENLPSIWTKYWPPKMSIFDVFSRPFGSNPVKKSFLQLLKDFNPDVVHLNNIHTQLSPVIAEIAHERGIRVVWTLHDTKLVCPAYTCQRDGKWCDECFTRQTVVIKHRCLPGSFIGAFIGWREIRKWNIERLTSCTDLFLPPSQFLKKTMVRGGYSPKKFKVLCNFIEVEKVKDQWSNKKEDYYVFLGRVDDYKGVKTLCRAANKVPCRLKIIGDGPLKNLLSGTYKSNSNIDFLGQLAWNDLCPILAHARFMVLPSECSENNPLSVIESQSLGTPVLGARIGGIPELIDENVSGLTFESGNVEDLKNKIEMMWNASFDYQSIAENAVKRYSSEAYYEQLMKYYKGEE